MALKDCNDDELEAIAKWWGDFVVNDRGLLLLDMMQIEDPAPRSVLGAAYYLPPKERERRRREIESGGDPLGHFAALERLGFLTRHPGPEHGSPDDAAHAYYSVNPERIDALVDAGRPAGIESLAEDLSITLDEALELARQCEARGELSVELTPREVLVRLHGREDESASGTVLAFRTRRSTTR